MQELKPCPFCGGEVMAIRNHTPQICGFWCETCNYEIKYSYPDEAIRTWNKRAEAERALEGRRGEGC